ncbi:hypothetical protein V6Z11_D04G151700 [Gossypium hirsutum]
MIPSDVQNLLQTKIPNACLCLCLNDTSNRPSLLSYLFPHHFS